MVRSRRLSGGWAWLVAAVLMWVAPGVAAQTAKLKPRVPVGVDPGGVAIGLITTGIDYKRPEIARCLARDGEGRLIGWDVVDRDGLPFAARNAAVTDDDNALIGMLPCDGHVRVVPVRVDPADAMSVGKALAFLAQTPARIVVLPVGSQPKDWAPFRAAAAQFKSLMVIVAGDDTSDVVQARVLYQAVTADNVAIVGAVSGSERPRFLIDLDVTFASGENLTSAAAMLTAREIVCRVGLASKPSGLVIKNELKKLVITWSTRFGGIPTPLRLTPHCDTANQH